MVKKSKDVTGSLTPSLNPEEKTRIALLALLFVLLAILGALSLINLSIEVILALIFAGLLFMINVVLRYVESVKFGDFEFRLGQSQQQQEFINDLQQRLTGLEKQIMEVSAPPNPKLVDRFEQAAQDFRRGDRAERRLAENEMVYTGIRLGKTFLFSKLEGGKREEQAGAAAALGMLDDPQVIFALVQALEHDSSFVRYRSAKSIERLAGLLDKRQVQDALTQLGKTVRDESNVPTKKAMQSAILALKEHR